MEKDAMITEIVRLLEKMPVEHVKRMLIKCSVCLALIEEKEQERQGRMTER